MLNPIDYEKECKKITNGFVLDHRDVSLGSDDENNFNPYSELGGDYFWKSDINVHFAGMPRQLKLYNHFVKKSKHKSTAVIVVSGYLRMNLKYFNVHVPEIYRICFDYYYLNDKWDHSPSTSLSCSYSIYGFVDYFTEDLNIKEKQF